MMNGMKLKELNLIAGFEKGGHVCYGKVPRNQA